MNIEEKENEKQTTDHENNSDDSLTQLENERDQMKALAQRTQADFVNYKRRMEEERQLISQISAGKVIARILSIVDDLERAIAAIPDNAASKEWLNGINLILQNLESVIASEGFEKFIPLEGESFDPSKHEAVHYLESNEQIPGHILNTFRAGYIAGDRVLRPAQVIVAKEANE